MSDLAATNCGCSDNSCSGGSSIILILLILCLCGNNCGGSGLFSSNGNGCFGDDCGCIILILLILCSCGNSCF